MKIFLSGSDTLKTETRKPLAALANQTQHSIVSLRQICYVARKLNRSGQGEIVSYSRSSLIVDDCLASISLQVVTRYTCR